MDSYFDYLYWHDTPITVDPFEEFLDTHGSLFSSVQLPLESTTFFVAPLEKFLDIHGSPSS